MPGEFELIARHFAALTPARGGVVLGPGDDAALLDLPPGRELVVTVDTLVAGVHFFDDCPPAALGHKALAVNLSDLAAMGAEPAWALLALTLPAADDAWLAQFASGFAALAREFDVSLVGGDTCRGPLAISVTALGHAPRGQALRRRGARPGDGVYVSGEIGAAGLAVRQRRSEITLPPVLAAHAAQRLDYPQPRVTLGLALRGLASAAIDVSDGLLADLGHICAASRTGARLDLNRVPLPDGALDVASHDSLLGFGDDYELCFTVPPQHAPTLRALAARAGCAVTRIGQIEAAPGLWLVDAGGNVRPVAGGGHDHFR
jgi:thiamine-monophosphate kinase